jgi:hypothetical protein
MGRGYADTNIVYAFLDLNLLEYTGGFYAPDDFGDLHFSK